MDVNVLALVVEAGIVCTRGIPSVEIRMLSLTSVCSTRLVELLPISCFFAHSNGPSAVTIAVGNRTFDGAHIPLINLAGSLNVFFAVCPGFR